MSRLQQLTSLIAGLLLLCLAPAVSSLADPTTGRGAGHAASDEAQKANQSAQTRAIATFAAGCYWCVESDFDKVKGVTATISGFMGGHVKNPTYKQVSRGGTGHIEVLQVTYDPRRVTYKALLDHFWRNVDPLDGGGQFCDRGYSYKPAIFAHNEEQRRLAETSKIKVAKRFQKPIAVEIRDASTFTPAGEHHQNYYKKHPWKYKYYRYGCGRDQRLRTLWGAKTG
jgi:methionine-S-sulfoxide reductase